jgi:hypothetical protein
LFSMCRGAGKGFQHNLFNVIRIIGIVGAIMLFKLKKCSDVIGHFKYCFVDIVLQGA